MIRGFWKTLPQEVGDVLIQFMKKVEQAFEDGYLYIEKYGEDDDYFESEEMNEYVVKFVNTLPEDIQGGYREQVQVQEVLENSGYSTFLSVEQKLL